MTLTRTAWTLQKFFVLQNTQFFINKILQIQNLNLLLFVASLVATLLGHVMFSEQGSGCSKNAKRYCEFSVQMIIEGLYLFTVGFSISFIGYFK